MAVIIRRKPSDIVWSDIDPRFITDSQGNIKIATNVDSVAASIDNILGTFIGERVMLPEFASKFRDLLFEPIDEDMMSFLSTEVKQVIEAWDDRVKVVTIDTSTDPDNGAVYLNIQFAVKSYQGTFTLSKQI